MTSKAKHAQRSRKTYRERQREARTFLNHCYMKNEIKTVQRNAGKTGFFARLFRRRTDNHE